MTHRLIVGVSLIFCIVVVLLLIILYYPKGYSEEELDVIFVTTKQNELPGANQDRTTDDYYQDSETKSTFAEVARALENFGAAFLALGAVICVAVGFACIVCACSCVM